MIFHTSDISFLLVGITTQDKLELYLLMCMTWPKMTIIYIMRIVLQSYCFEVTNFKDRLEK